MNNPTAATTETICALVNKKTTPILLLFFYNMLREYDIADLLLPGTDYSIFVDQVWLTN